MSEINLYDFGFKTKLDYDKTAYEKTPDIIKTAKQFDKIRHAGNYEWFIAN